VGVENNFTNKTELTESEGGGKIIQSAGGGSEGEIKGGNVGAEVGGGEAGSKKTTKRPKTAKNQGRQPQIWERTIAKPRFRVEIGSKNLDAWHKSATEGRGAEIKETVRLQFGREAGRRRLKRHFLGFQAWPEAESEHSGQENEKRQIREEKGAM